MLKRPKGDWVDERRTARILDDGQSIRKVMFNVGMYGWAAKTKRGAGILTDWMLRNVLDKSLYDFHHSVSIGVYMILPKGMKIK